MIFIKNLTKRYKSKNRTVCTALDNVSLTLPDKGMIFIIGKSGSGKSTLLNMIGGLDSFDSGRIISCGNDLSTFRSSDFYKYRASHVGFIFQDFHLIEELSVADNIRLSCEIANVSARDVEKVLEAVDLRGYGGRFPSELSGGEKQRVVIARALIKNPEVILCDEPAGNLDNNTSAQIMELLHKISRDKLVVTVSHDMPDAEKYGDRVIELQGGKIVRDSTKRQGYKNDLTVEGGVLVLPHNKNLTPRDIAAIKSYNRTSPIRDLRQNDDGYDPTGKIEDSNKRTYLKSSKMSFGSIMKLFFAFLGSSKVRALATALISTVMLVLLIIMQSFLAFDGNRAIADTMRDEGDAVILQKSVHTHNGEEVTQLVYPVSDDDLAIIDEFGSEGMNKHFLYSYTLSPFFDPLIETETLPASHYGINNILSTEMFGTLACTEDYLVKKFGKNGELVVLAGDINKTKENGSIILTDYLADAILDSLKWDNIEENLQVYYENLLGEIKIDRILYGEIAAIIYTGYKEKYAEEISIVAENPSTSTVEGIYLLPMEKVTSLTRDIKSNLAIAYTLNEDFVGALANTSSENANPQANIYGFGITNEELGVSSTVLVNSLRSSINISQSAKCPSGEIILHSASFSMLRSAGVIPEDISYDNQGNLYFAFDEPIKITFSRHEYVSRDSEAFYEKEFIIKGFSAKERTALMNPADYEELLRYDVIPYAVYIDDYENADEIVNALEHKGYIWPAANNEIIDFLADSVEMFVDLFEMLEVFTLVMIVAFIGYFGISNVKSNQYQIGVIKAMGGKSGDIAKIYLLENAVITILICGLSYLGAILSVDKANELVLSSFETIVGEKFGQLTIIAFSNEIIFTAFAITLVIGLVSTLIPLLILHRIKPIKIIKAKE